MKEGKHMKNIDEIIESYTKGKITKEKANEELIKIGSTVRINPDAYVVTPEEEKLGWGYLHTGTGYPDKCKADMKKMELEFDDMGEMYAIFEINGKTYEVNGKKLVELK